LLFILSTLVDLALGFLHFPYRKKCFQDTGQKQIFRLALATLLLSAMSQAAMADGFAVKDFTTLTFDPASMPGNEFMMRNDDPGRATIACIGCSGLVAVDVLLGTSTDGTEQRYRSGQTTLEMMEGQCRAKAPSCIMVPANLGRATGRTSQFDIGSTFGSTTILFLDGDLLTVRSLADTKDAAFANGQAILNSLGKQIVGE
jgi:hypothetical protein